MTGNCREFVLTLSCPDTRGIVYAVSGVLYQGGCNILDSQQFGDRASGLFFMRVHFEAPEHLAAVDRLQLLFESTRAKFGMQAQFHDLARRPRLLLLVSRHGHCLNDLLFRWKSGQLRVDIPAVASNHPDFRTLVESYGVPFYHLPLSPGASGPQRAAQEAQILALVQQHGIDLVVLARYMQILSPSLCERLRGRAINIHHSFLPSFKGAQPYRQAFERGVKLIGATAHYVDEHLDEGPIIEQEVQRVDHSMDPEELAAVGRDLECITLARAVRWHCEHRVLLNGSRTVVFR
ncbi:MAG: formyltetrahydrofolate deformylase [Sutterellaceae bacterium]|nr:formyltetrahydrofolate deformylase [Burkholderiaceae bacterium]MCX7901660.1 formyltetrahydrofolate deformylase [Burkholderiaceae bacterium]MDW8430967.1 formyltetrahydrofolate deformylase [Sutterellaceae bacterium]